MPWGREQLTQLVDEAERGSTLPPGLMRAIAEVESNWNPRAVSPKGASGLFQFMPRTAQAYGVDPRDPRSSAQGARRMLEDLWRQHDGDLNKVLASYNWGSGNLARRGLDAMPSETRNYIDKVRTVMGAQLGTPPGDAPASMDGIRVAVVPAAAPAPATATRPVAPQQQAISYSDELTRLVKSLFGTPAAPAAAPAPQPNAQQARDALDRIDAPAKPAAPAQRKQPTRKDVAERIKSKEAAASSLLGTLDSISGLPQLFEGSGMDGLNSQARSEYMAQLARILQQFKDSPDGFMLDSSA